MLLNFTFNNFLSFKDSSTLNFCASSLKEFNNENTTIYNPKHENRLLKSLMIYGPNSSGKSNIIKAFNFVRSLMINSSKDLPIQINKFKLNIHTEERSSIFEIRISLSDKIYKYGFSINKDIIESEWLKVTERLKEETYFERSGQHYLNDEKIRKNSHKNYDLVKSSTKSNVLFLSALSHWNVSEDAIDIIGWITNNVTIILDDSNINLIEYTSKILKDPNYRRLLNHVIRNSDLSIESIEDIIANVKETDREYALEVNNDLTQSIRTKHKRYDDDDNHIDTLYFNLLREESQGTQRFIGLMGMIIVAILENKIIFIDELDSKLHEDLLLMIIRFFNSSINNPNKSQLVAVLHNSVILEDPKLKIKKTVLRRDQLIFVEKDLYGSSSFLSLYEKNPEVRNDASLRKDYRSGKYKAIPNINSQLNLF